jgi:hypothetical protein
MADRNRTPIRPEYAGSEDDGLVRADYTYSVSTIEPRELSEGLWLVMAGETQRFWVHQVPKTTAAVERRINLTFRRMTLVHQP